MNRLRRTHITVALGLLESLWSLQWQENIWETQWMLNRTAECWNKWGTVGRFGHNFELRWTVEDCIEEMLSSLYYGLSEGISNVMAPYSRIPQVSTLITSAGIPNSCSHWIKLKTADEMGKTNDFNDQWPQARKTARGHRRNKTEARLLCKPN